MLELSDGQQRVLDDDGNLLVLGGPGSGKTTIANLKARKIVRESLRPAQRVLFLSFARSSVARIVEALDEGETNEQCDKRLIEVHTYHAFFWRLIRSHAYLLGFPRRLSILLPAAEAVALSEIRAEYGPIKRLTVEERNEKHSRECAERIRLAREEGRIAFELFGGLAAQILNGSRRVRELTCETFPYVIVDEFQDTNDDEWTVLKALAKRSVLMVLADPEQRIYEFKGAKPDRIDHYREECQPSEHDLNGANYRSPGTEIQRFGDDILTGRFSQDSYKGVHVVRFPGNPNQAYYRLKSQILQARRRLTEAGRNPWSLALLVPTKKMIRVVSDYLRASQTRMPEINHLAAVEAEPVILAAEIIAFLLQPVAVDNDFASFVRLVCRFYEGRGGDSPTKKHITQSRQIASALEEAQEAEADGKKVRGNSPIIPMRATYQSARAVVLTGDPDTDWITVRRQLENGPCTRLQEVANEARNLRLLNRGTQLRSTLSATWRGTLAYPEALEMLRQALVQEHFAKAWKPESGIVVMNMHKAKGKQFDEVIVFEGWPRRRNGAIATNFDRIVRNNSTNEVGTNARQNFRVSVTRAKIRVTILTPESDPCLLLPSLSPQGFAGRIEESTKRTRRALE